MTISYHDVPLDGDQDPPHTARREPSSSMPDIEMDEAPFDPSMLGSGSMPSIEIGDAPPFDIHRGSLPVIEMGRGSLPSIEIDGLAPRTVPQGSQSSHTSQAARGAQVSVGSSNSSGTPARASMPSIQVTTTSMPSIDLDALEELGERDTLVPQTSALGSLPVTPAAPARPPVTAEKARPPAGTPKRGAGSPVATAARRTLSSIERPRCDALELRTFVVPESELPVRSSEAQRRAFLRDRLAQHLRCDPSSVRRIDIKLFEPGAVMLRVWCPVD